MVKNKPLSPKNKNEEGAIAFSDQDKNQ